MLPYREDLSHSLEENGFTAFINYKEGRGQMACLLYTSDAADD